MGFIFAPILCFLFFCFFSPFLLLHESSRSTCLSSSISHVVQFMYLVVLLVFADIPVSIFSHLLVVF